MIRDFNKNIRIVITSRENSNGTTSYNLELQERKNIFFTFYTILSHYYVIFDCCPAWMGENKQYIIHIKPEDFNLDIAIDKLLKNGLNLDDDQLLKFYRKIKIKNLVNEDIGDCKAVY